MGSGLLDSGPQNNFQCTPFSLLYRFALFKFKTGVEVLQEMIRNLHVPQQSNMIAFEPCSASIKHCNRNTSKSKGQMLQGSLLRLWMDENASQQSNKNC